MNLKYDETRRGLSHLAGLQGERECVKGARPGVFPVDGCYAAIVVSQSVPNPEEKQREERPYDLEVYGYNQSLTCISINNTLTLA